MEVSVFFDKVLLVEDDAGHTLLVKRALREFCGIVLLAETKAAALQVLGDNSVDLIVTDLNLPDSTGVSHVQQLSSVSLGAPLIVLTSSTSLRDAVQAMQLGAQDFLVKDFDGNFREVLGLSLSRLHKAREAERERTRLRREMEVLRQAIENNNDGLAVSDGQGRIQYSNRSFAQFVRLCGGRDPGLLGAFGDRIIKSRALGDAIKEKLSTLGAGAVWSTEVRFADAPDQAFDLSLSAFAVGGQPPDGEEKLMVVWVRDIAELKRRERFQRELLSTTSHDLKGPLGGIALSAEMLTETLENGSRPYEIALRVGSAAQAAINLIDEFLSARRLEEGTFILRPTECDIQKLMDNVVTTFRSIASARRVGLRAEAKANLLACVDQLGFERVLANLLSNALKFTQPGGSVQVGAQRIEGDLVVEVIDSGSGMEPAEIQRIFERFSRLERHAGVAGSGLGLFVVKSIVTAHGGKVEVTSQVGKGTTFQVVFPADPPVNERGELIALDFA